MRSLSERVGCTLTVFHPLFHRLDFIQPRLLSVCLLTEYWSLYASAHGKEVYSRCCGVFFHLKTIKFL